MVCTKYATKKKYREQCLIMALINLRCLGEIVTTMETVDKDLQLTVTDVRDCSATLKGKKFYDTESIMRALLVSIQKYVDDNFKRFSEIVEEKYEFTFDRRMVDMEFINDFVDLTKDGKHVYIDIDH